MKKDYNYGVSILRIIFCYMVVNFHFYGLMYGDNRFYFLRELAVPVFIFISFYFGYKVISSGDTSSYKKRMIRLIVPYLFWGIVPFIGLFLVSLFTSIPRPSLRDLFMQVVFGSNERLNAPLWFMWEMLVLTVLFIIIYRLFKKYTIVVLVLLMIASYVIQYTNVNLVFYETLPYELYNDFGRFFEVLPLACAGYITADINLTERVLKRRWLGIIFFIVAVLCVLFVEKIPSPFITFAYAGVKHLIVTELLFLSFYCIPFAKVPSMIKSFIKVVSSYTMGVYFLHWMVGKVMNVFWLRFFGVEKTLAETFVIFIICMIGCFIIDRIPLRFTKMLIK